jgi:hypothetical protein
MYAGPSGVFEPEGLLGSVATETIGTLDVTTGGLTRHCEARYDATG